MGLVGSVNRMEFRLCLMFLRSSPTSLRYLKLVRLMSAHSHSPSNIIRKAQLPCSTTVFVTYARLRQIRMFADVASSPTRRGRRREYCSSLVVYNLTVLHLR